MLISSNLIEVVHRRVFIQVTPDGERTMRTCLAAASGLYTISQLPEDWSKNSNLFHLEGYVMYKPQLCHEILSTAKQKGIMVRANSLFP